MTLDAQSTEPSRTHAVSVFLSLGVSILLGVAVLAYFGRAGAAATWIDGGYWALGIAIAALLAVAGTRVRAHWGSLIGGLTIAVGAVTGAFFLALAGAIFSMGFDGLAFALGLGAGCLLLQLVVAPRFAQTGAQSLADLFALRYPGRAARIACALAVGISMLTLLVAELMATGLIGSRLLGVDYGLAIVVGAFAVFACFIVRGSGSGGLDGFLFPILIVAVLVPLVMLSASWYGLPVPQIAYGNALAQLQGLEENLLEQELADPAYMKPMMTAFLTMTPLNFAGIVLGLALGVAALPSLLRRQGAAAGTAREARWSAFWALLFVAFLLTLAPVAAAYAKLQIATLIGDRTPIANLPAWVFTYGKLGMLQICGQAATDAAAVARACAALPDPGPALRLQDITLDPDVVTLALPEITGLNRAWLGLMATAALAMALVTALGPLTSVVSAVIGNHADAHGEQRTPRLASYGVAAVALAATAFAAVAHPAGIVEVATWSFTLVASSLFPALFAALWWRRASSFGAAAAMLVGLAVALIYLIGPQVFPVPFFEATAMFSNAGVSGLEYLGELKDAWSAAEPGAAKDAAWVAVEAYARSSADWWGISGLAAALLAVPASIVTLVIVSLLAPAPRRTAETAP
jgi:cation/acetate symporter